MRSKQTCCVGGRHMSNTTDIIEYGKKSWNTKKSSKLEKENVIFVAGVKRKILISKGHEDWIFKQKQNVKTDNVDLCRSQHGVI